MDLLKPIIRPSTLYYGDCLEVMGQWDPNQVDLIYLDPPFKSDRFYNLTFGAKSGTPTAQMMAFDDTWAWTEEAAERLGRLSRLARNTALAETLGGLRLILGESSMFAYVTYMAERLLHCRRLLKPNGSIYLHCDDTAAHYLRLVMNAVFGPDSFQNEIVWRRVLGGKSDAGRYGRSSDRILFYTMSDDFHFDPPRLTYHHEDTLSWYSNTDEHGKYTRHKLTAHGSTQGDSGQPWRGKAPAGHWVVPRILEERYRRHTGKTLTGTVRERLEKLAQAGLVEFSKSGLPSFRKYLNEADFPRVHDIWDDSDVKPIARNSPERTGFPTQKPVALLERIIKASCPPQGLVLDPFCGCGTTVVAAQTLGRRWAGIDISPFAVETVMRERFRKSNITGVQIEGIPTTIEGARMLAKQPFRFEEWSVSQVPGLVPNKRKVGDQGVDGMGRMLDQDEDGNNLIIAQVKTTKVTASAVRDFLYCMQRDHAAAGVFIVLDRNQVSAKQDQAARTHGKLKIPNTAGAYPKLQFWYMEDWLTQSDPMERRRKLPILPRMADPFTGKEAQPPTLFTNT